MNNVVRSLYDPQGGRGWLRSPFLLLICCLMLVGGSVTVVWVYAANGTSAQVTIDASSSLGQIPSTAFGINTAVWDGHLDSSSVPYMQKMGVKVMRYPGGSTADTYNWQTNTIAPS